VVLANLSALALSSVRRLRAVAWLLAALVCVSTVLTGWHYGVDVLGGLLVAMMTALAVRRIAL
jgi:membrane-associated phospholipid phosphatase